MHRVNVKPLSVNEAYRGRRFKTKEKVQYDRDVSIQLPRIKVPNGNLEVHYVFGVSSKGGDCDNLIKSFQDCLSSNYGFNDNKIMKITAEKVYVSKGNEYIEFDIYPCG